MYIYVDKEIMLRYFCLLEWFLVDFIFILIEILVYKIYENVCMYMYIE